MDRSKKLTLGTILAMWLLCGGCAGEPFVYVPQNDLKSGPGLFSGEDGEVTLINTTREIKQETDTKEAESDQ